MTTNPDIEAKAREIANSAIELYTHTEIKELAARITSFAEAEYRRGVEDAAKVTDRWAGSASCTTHDNDPCCHVRTGAGIANHVRALLEADKPET